VLLRQSRVEEDYELTKRGEKAARARREADASMWRNTQRENMKDNRLRAKTFWVGAILVIFGFVGQLVGSLPYGNSIFGLTSCS
jgi:hypothetical protein